MKWDIEELAEDAIAAHIKANVSGDLVVLAAFSAPLQFPCVVVGVDASSPVSDLAEWHDARQMRCTVGILSEYTPEVDDAQVPVATARERNAAMRSAVMGVLARADLAAVLNAVGINGIAFDVAQVVGVTRSTDAGRVLTTAIEVELIAEPVEGT